jgi:predicted dehydrogenase
MNPLRVAIVGAGNLSTRRIYPNVGAAGGRIVGVCDLDIEKARQNAALWGGEAFTEVDAMLDAARPEAVIICVGPGGHAALAPRVLERGIPVYTEKPPALTSADALRVAHVSRETGILCTTAFKKRYATCYSRARAFIDEFTAEDRLSLSIDYASAHYGNERPEHTFILDFAIHVIDLTCYLFGHPETVFALSNGGHAWAVSLGFPGGAVGTLNLTDGRAFDVPTEEVEITCRGGNFMTVSNSSRWRIAREGKCCEWREPPTFVSAGDSGNDTGHLAELVDFVRAVREGTGTRSEIAQSYRSMVLYEAIVRSAETSAVVTPEYEL